MFHRYREGFRLASSRCRGLLHRRWRRRRLEFFPGKALTEFREMGVAWIQSFYLLQTLRDLVGIPAFRGRFESLLLNLEFFQLLPQLKGSRALRIGDQPSIQ